MRSGNVSVVAERKRFTLAPLVRITARLASRGLRGPRLCRALRQHANVHAPELHDHPRCPSTGALFTWTGRTDGDGTRPFDRDRPLHIDIGSASGSWLIDLAMQDASFNRLGLETRRDHVAAATRAAAAGGVLHRTVAFLHTNLLLSHATFLTCEGAPRVALLTVLHPDPHFKGGHKPRRVVSAATLPLLAALCAPGARLLVQSDVRELYGRMAADLADCPWFDRAGGGGGDGGLGVADAPPFLGVPTPREALVRRQGGRVFGAAYVRNARVSPCPPPPPTVPPAALVRWREREAGRRARAAAGMAQDAACAPRAGVQSAPHEAIV